MANHYLIQYIKCKQLFSSLLSNEKTRTLLKLYLEKQNLKNVADYLGKTSVLFELCLNSNGSYVDPVNYPKTHAFIENFSTTQISNDIHDDFLHIRNKPIIKLEDNVYRAIHAKFINDKLYIGLIFDLKKLNMENEIGISNLSSLLGENFFEDICTIFLNKLFKNNSIRISGKEIKKNRSKNKINLDGEADYYIRNHNDIFLFEIKNNLIKSEIKYSFNYPEIEKYLKERFIENNGSKKIILQLIESYKFILSNKCEFDEIEISKLRNVYFITILPEESYSSYGMNCIANEWFNQEISKIEENQHKIKTKPLIIITIDTLIYCIYYIQMGKIKFKDILDIYIKNHVESKSAKQRSISFTMFIYNHIQELKSPSMDFNYSKIISSQGFDEIL